MSVLIITNITNTNTYVNRCSNDDSDKEICGWVTRQTERELATALSIGVEDLKKLNVLRSFDLDNYDWG